MALAFLSACFEDDAEALLLGCAAALEPEANCPLDTRIQCLKSGALLPMSSSVVASSFLSHASLAAVSIPEIPCSSSWLSLRPSCARAESSC